MAGRFRKAALYLGLVDDDDESAEYDDEYADRDYRHEDGETAAAGPVAAWSGSRNGMRRPPVAAVRSGATESYRITTVQPRTYNEARTIGEHFRDGVPVIINLTEMDDADAKRLVDFAAGLIFGLHGSIERVTNKVFLLSPSNVDVSAEDKARIAESGFFNQS